MTMTAIASAACPRIAAVGAPPPRNRKNAGKTPSSAIRAYTRGPAITSEKTEVVRATTMMKRIENAPACPPIAWAAAAATSSLPATASKGGR